MLKYLNLCIEHDLPFSTFDILRAACTNSKIAANLFMFIVCNFPNKIEFIRVCEKLENELGFRFNWVSYDSFIEAFNWITDSYGLNPADFSIISEIATQYVDAKYLFREGMDVKLPQDFLLNREIVNMRARLGEKVINELPIYRPWLSKEQKQIIVIDNERLKIIVRTPITVALMKVNQYETPKESRFLNIWHPNNYEIRRNMMYCENLDKEWFSLAVNYTLKKINK